MIKLSELLHNNNNLVINRDEKELNLIPTDNWKATDCMYLEDIGFRDDGIYYYSLKIPEITICYRKGEGFIVDDKSEDKKDTFKTFKELESHFSNYNQKWKNEPYL